MIARPAADERNHDCAPRLKVFLLVGSEFDDFWLAVLEPLLTDERVTIVGACVDVRPASSTLRRLRDEIRKGRGGYVVVMACKRMGRSLTPGSTPALSYLRERGVAAWETDDLYASDTLDRIRESDPDCLFRSGFGLIREPVLSLAPRGVLSYHHGDIRRFRGQPVGFWELYEGAEDLTVTVQVLSPKLDAGDIVVERTVAIEPAESWRSLERRAFDASTTMMYGACLLLLDPAFVPEPVGSAELGMLYTLPNLRQWLGLNWRVLMRRARRRQGHAARDEARTGARRASPDRSDRPLGRVG